MEKKLSKKERVNGHRMNKAWEEIEEHGSLEKALYFGSDSIASVLGLKPEMSNLQFNKYYKQNKDVDA